MLNRNLQVKVNDMVTHTASNDLGNKRRADTN